MASSPLHPPLGSPLPPSNTHQGGGLGGDTAEQRDMVAALLADYINLATPLATWLDETALRQGEDSSLGELNEASGEQCCYSDKEAWQGTYDAVMALGAETTHTLDQRGEHRAAAALAQQCEQIRDKWNALGHKCIRLVVDLNSERGRPRYVSRIHVGQSQLHSPTGTGAGHMAGGGDSVSTPDLTLTPSPGATYGGLRQLSASPLYYETTDTTDSSQHHTNIVTIRGASSTMPRQRHRATSGDDYIHAERRQGSPGARSNWKLTVQLELGPGPDQAHQHRSYIALHSTNYKPVGGLQVARVALMRSEDDLHAMRGVPLRPGERSPPTRHLVQVYADGDGSGSGETWRVVRGGPMEGVQGGYGSPEFDRREVQWRQGHGARELQSRSANFTETMETVEITKRQDQSNSYTYQQWVIEQKAPSTPGSLTSTLMRCQELPQTSFEVPRCEREFGYGRSAEQAGTQISVDSSNGVRGAEKYPRHTHEERFRTGPLHHAEQFSREEKHETGGGGTQFEEFTIPAEQQYEQMQDESMVLVELVEESRREQPMRLAQYTTITEWITVYETLVSRLERMVSVAERESDRRDTLALQVGRCGTLAQAQDVLDNDRRFLSDFMDCWTVRIDLRDVMRSLSAQGDKLGQQQLDEMQGTVSSLEYRMDYLREQLYRTFMGRESHLRRLCHLADQLGDSERGVDRLFTALQRDNSTGSVYLTELERHETSLTTTSEACGALGRELERSGAHDWLPLTVALHDRSAASAQLVRQARQVLVQQEGVRENDRQLFLSTAREQLSHPLAQLSDDASATSALSARPGATGYHQHSHTVSTDKDGGVTTTTYHRQYQVTYSSATGETHSDYRESQL